MIIVEVFKIIPNKALSFYVWNPRYRRVAIWGGGGSFIFCYLLTNMFQGNVGYLNSSVFKLCLILGLSPWRKYMDSRSSRIVR
jgi:hypothetical protein